MMKRYKYNINNIDCAHCAREIEEGLNKDKRLRNVVVNFSTSKISYESENEVSLKELNKLVEKIEEGVTITEEEVHQTREYHVLILILGLLLGIAGTFLPLEYWLEQLCILTSYIILLYKPFINAIKMLLKSKTINENFLIVISCTGAYIIGENLEGIMVISLYILGKILEEKTVNNTRSSIKNLINLKENFANKKVSDKIEKVLVEELKINDVMVIKKGEKIPVDGKVVKGSTFLDTSMLTGESKLVTVNENDFILSGSINKGEIIEVIVTATYKESTVARILSLLEDATDKKTKTETLVSKLSKIYTPIVIILAILLGIFLPMVSDASYSESIYRALTFLVISCPCAIAISVPLSYFTGIGVSSKNGILIKGSNYLDNLSVMKKIIFDKTGTLTTGNFKVSNIKIHDESYREDEIIEILVKGEFNSNHPIAESILELANKKIDNSDVSNYKEIEGKGISYNIGEDKIKIGNNKICNCGTDAVLHLNINNRHIASITIDDGIKKEASKAIENLKLLGIRTYMFTGDKKETAKEIGKKLKLDEIKYEMLPTDKYNEYEKVKDNNEIVAFVGDGINDAPTLKRADIGISMGNIGSSSAIEASDIVIIKDDLEKIPLAIKISKYTNKIIKQNLIFAISVKVIILLLSVFGITKMWFAVFADTGVTLITILNTLRIMTKFKNK